ncbi:MAG: ACT domain-containing protein [Bacteroidota bacterium]
MIIHQLTVFLENESGRLTEVTRILAENNINISAFSIAETADYGILRMIVSNPEIAVEKLKERQFSVNLTEVICMIVPHEPGGLSKALSILSGAGLSIEYMYAFAVSENKATVVLRTDDPKKAIKVLQEHKLELIKASDIYEL